MTKPTHSRLALFTSETLEETRVDEQVRTGALPAVGERFARRYRITEELGRGTMGAAFRAFDLAEGRFVVLKLLAGRDPRARVRFLRGTKILLQLRHRSVARAQGYGEFGGVSFVVLGDLQGISLQALLERRPRCAWSQGALRVADLCDALAHLHARGAVHRDVKPANLIVSDDSGQETLVLIDFDLAKSFGEDEQESGRFKLSEAREERGLETPRLLSVTDRHKVLGTPLYMTLERLCGGAATPDSDIYAAGLVLYSMLCGSLPTGGADHRSVRQLARARVTAPLSAAAWGVKLPPEGERILQKALSPRRSERYASAQELAFDLRATLLKSRGPRHLWSHSARN